jgi:hypothetical protein
MHTYELLSMCTGFIKALKGTMQANTETLILTVLYYNLVQQIFAEALDLLESGMVR